LKDIFIVLKVTLIGLLVAVFFYPLIHESGHIIATLLTGGKFISMAWLPAPNVLCEVDSTNNAALAITSLAGMMFPMLLILPFYKSKGSLRFGVLIFNAVTVLSMIIGLSVIILRMFGTITPNDDITAFIDFTGWLLPTLFILIGLTTITILQFILLKPKQTFMAILGIQSEQKQLEYQHSHPLNIENI